MQDPGANAFPVQICRRSYYLFMFESFNHLTKMIIRFISITLYSSRLAKCQQLSYVISKLPCLFISYDDNRRYFILRLWRLVKGNHKHQEQPNCCHRYHKFTKSKIGVHEASKNRSNHYTCRVGYVEH